jgi:DEAD/DEAH box helicase domain-containing protein
VGNFLQRIGRAGRETGNALIVTQCRNDRPHDLYYFAAPNDMVSGSVQAPGTFLNAPEVLFRQWFAYCLDAWGRTDEGAFVPPSVAKLLAAKKSGGSFPQGFLGYLEPHTQALLDGFCALFSDTLRPDTRERLQAAAADLPRRVLAALDETQAQIELLQTYRRRIDERVKKLGGDTRLTEDQRAHQSRELERDRKYIESQLRERNGCNTYQFLVEHGLLPNYAFPEDAVTLHAFIYDIPEAGGGGGGGGRKGRGNGHEKHAWQRPASMALREFAPFNSFYAGARHVHVDRVAAGTRTRSTIAPQVFCSRCSCIVPQAEVATAEPCPRCGDKHFGEQGQVRDAVPLKEVGAREPHHSSLSLDNQEERERATYDTKVVFDVDPEAKRFAWADETTPFGYEFLSRVRLTELNLGPRRASGERMTLCGESLPASGFEICDDCGVVRNPGDDEAESRGEQTRTRHLFRCRSRKDKPGFRRVFLTRQMESEAIRVLLPISTVEVEKRLLNLRAALELGLRLKFRGEPMHLRVEASSEPCGDGEYRRFLMLYDVVPGGTGYLKELVQQPQAMLQLLRDALAHLQACTCGAEARHDPIASSAPKLRGGDGCYRCLYGRGTSFHLPKLSKQLAIELLAELVAAGPRLVPMPTLSDLTLERVTESELEELFLQRFRELCAKRGYAETLGISNAGRTEYTFTRDKARFVLKLQAELGPTDGVAFACRPDFLLQRISEPDGSRSEAPAVAVFCDGYAFHAQRNDGSTIVHDDIKKRCAIVRSGRMRVWTLTWEEVQGGGDGARATALWGLEGNKAKQTLARYWREQRPDRNKEDLWTLTPLDLFIFLACEAPAGDWLALAGGYVAAMLAQGPVRSSEAAFAAARTRVLEHGAATPTLEDDGSETGNWVGADRTWGEARLLLAMNAEQLKQKKSAEITSDVLRWHVHLDDNKTARQADTFQDSWRRFWALVNVLQPMTDGQLSSQEAAVASVDGDLAPPDVLMRMGELPQWLHECSPDLWDVMVPLAQAAVPTPDILVEELGPDDAPDSSWGVVECAFTAARVAILHPNFMTGFDTEAALAAGWQVHVATAEMNVEAVAAVIGGKHGGAGNE